MWKTIVLCASLFAGAALGLTAVARWIEPSVVPAVAAIGLCLVGVVLILAAPAQRAVELFEDEDAPTTIADPAPKRVAVASGSHNAIPTPLPENRA